MTGRDLLAIVGLSNGALGGFDFQTCDECDQPLYEDAPGGVCSACTDRVSCAWCLGGEVEQDDERQLNHGICADCIEANLAEIERCERDAAGLERWERDHGEGLR